ncbi:hypothetical protein LCGC14_1344410 [marine sediment metagenome]|uniref:L-2-amino-thiazoline-4-carboxylic acid hydrolase n=1 Tax=marine sediment metagenome TaxID=412755 RepID=A0A0F9KCR3_9ZZZZ
MSKNRGALKFFQSFIYEMIDIGGINPPKSISSSLGTKLGKILKTRSPMSLENSLMKIYNVFNAKTKINTIDNNTFEISLRYKKAFCPIGGKYNPDRVDLIQKAICIPYTIAILNTSYPEFKYNAEVLDCILHTGKKFCRYRLNKEPK